MSVVILPDPIQAYAGDSWSQSFQFKQDDDTVMDLAGKEWAAQWRRESIADAKLDLTVDDSQASQGIITITATGEQTRKMTGTGVCDLQANDGPKTYVRFTIHTTWDVTR